ncbi:hypothetical protein [Candidatus Minimicrobia vallesae]|uniref:hypothetical protein n=1 Tax=Candidatus Minimicrobia vallesae TaxID=2841264 RepID=UPI001E59FA3D|nr:hypothetical protein [Candidatus Minimicrobia vallesae]
MSQLITGEKTPQQMKDMRECGKMLATIYDELKKSVTHGMRDLDANDFVAKRIKDFGAEATYLTDEAEIPGSDLYIDERAIGAFFPDRICF